MQKLKTILIGTGKVAHLHAPALQALPQSNFTAVYNHHLPKAQAFAKQYNVRPYDNLDHLIQVTVGTKGGQSFIFLAEARSVQIRSMRIS